MKKFFETSWHKINFNSFHKTSINEMPNSNFYNNFYNIFFNKYKSYEELDKVWISKKNEIADWILSRIKSGDNVLSVGCGIGYIESKLFNNKTKNFNLDIFDFAPTSIKWLMNEIPSENIYIMENKHSEKYDIIYFSAVDYALTNKELLDMIKFYRDNLKENGFIVLISASFLKKENSTIKNIVMLIKFYLNYLKVVIYKSKYQFWGWKRSQDEYRKIIINTGFCNFEDGFINSFKQESYYIIGYK